MKGFNYIITILLSTLALSGCIRNDGSGLDCERTRISFTYYGDIPELMPVPGKNPTR